MGSRSALAAAFGGAALLLCPAGAQAACSLKTTNVPVTMQGLRPLIDAKINGQPVKFLLDSGAFYNVVDARFAAQQKLKPAQRAVLGTRFKSSAATVATGAGGTEREAGIVIASSFEFGGAKFENVGFLTADGPGDATGILGQNFLHQMDNEYDLRNGLMRFVRPQDCETAELAYWATPGMTYSTLPLVTTNRINLHTVAMVEINSVRMRAYFDTGAATSFITRRAAARAGVKTTDPGVTSAGYTRGLDRADIITWIAPFSSIKIGDEEIKNTKLAIGESDADDFDILIGADFFLAHHVYVANSQGKLYFTYTGGPVFNLHPSETAASGDARPAK